MANCWITSYSLSIFQFKWHLSFTKLSQFLSRGWICNSFFFLCSFVWETMFNFSMWLIIKKIRGRFQIDILYSIKTEIWKDFLKVSNIFTWKTGYILKFDLSCTFINLKILKLWNSRMPWRSRQFTCTFLPWTLGKLIFRLKCDY